VALLGVVGLRADYVRLNGASGSCLVQHFLYLHENDANQAENFDDNPQPL
jgi:hypothetical protein